MFRFSCQHSINVAIFLIFACLSNGATAEILEEKNISGWKVTFLDTPNSGLSCQARKCNTRSCSDSKAVASILLWGSERRKAITPMIGADFADAGARNATLSIGELTFPAVQPNTDSNRYMTKDQSDDIVLLRSMAANQRKGTLTLATKKGSAVFTLKGLDRVLSYMEKKCGIPKP